MFSTTMRVELPGFEPGTLCLQSRCATSCANATDRKNTCASRLMQIDARSACRTIPRWVIHSNICLNSCTEYGHAIQFRPSRSFHFTACSVRPFHARPRSAQCRRTAGQCAAQEEPQHVLARETAIWGDRGHGPRTHAAAHNRGVRARTPFLGRRSAA